MQYISVKGDVIEVNPYTIQPFHRVQCIGLKGQIQAAHLSEGGVYDCICIASCNYYPRAAIIKTVDINGKIQYISTVFSFYTALSMQHYFLF